MLLKKANQLTFLQTSFCNTYRFLALLLVAKPKTQGHEGFLEGNLSSVVKIGCLKSFFIAPYETSIILSKK